MERIFMDENHRQADAMAARLKSDAMLNYQLHKDSGMTPQQAKKLAQKQVNLFLSQELYLNLSKY